MVGNYVTLQDQAHCSLKVRGGASSKGWSQHYGGVVCTTGRTKHLDVVKSGVTGGHM